MLGVGNQNDLGTPKANVGRLPDDTLVVEDRLSLEDAIAGASVQENAVPEAVQLDVDDFGRQPSLRDGREGVAETPQLAILASQGVIPHSAQLQLLLLFAQPFVFGAERVPCGKAFAQPAPGGRRGTDRELDRVRGCLQDEPGPFQPAVTLVQEHDHHGKDRIQGEAETQ
jgi:hypothetical protein